MALDLSRLRRFGAAPLAAALLGGLAVAPAAQAQAPEGVVVLEVVSGRGDLVTGGDALVRLTAPADADVADLVVTDDGRAVTDTFRDLGDGTALGLVTGLDLGRNVLQAELPDGRGARITLTNAPQAGPVFSGPLIEPWTCANGSSEPDCAQEPTVTYQYRSVASPGPLRPYDPENPSSDVATTTTDEGNEVPFIVRVEVGTSLRDEYRIAALWDPAQGDAPDPTAENPGFANKLVLTHGASCDTDYTGRAAPDVIFEDALSQGFAVASHSLDNAGHNCNLVTQAESLILTKELVAERFGPLRYTIGSGCSGGSLVQTQVANAYPGVYQGLIPQCSFTDAWSSAQQFVDYVGLRGFLEGSGSFEAQILPAQWPSIFGHANPANQISFTEVIPNSGDPSRSCTGLDEAQVYSADNPDGVRCTLQDYMVNVFGTSPDGKARRPISNVGVQYGLSGLLASIEGPSDPTRPPLTAAQFVALNAGVGGFDIDFEPIPERTVADPLAQERVYRSGGVNTGAHLDEVAIIDLGGPEPGAFHDIYRKYSMRDRLVRQHGTAANQVFWEGQTPLLGDPSFVDDAITAMDEWLAAIEADTSDAPLAAKIVTAKETAGIAERCVGTDGLEAPLAFCDATVDATLFSSPRIEAGGGDPVVGFTDDRLDCQTIPLDDADYAGQTFAETFTEEQQATLRETFPTGVCDYSRPGNGFQPAVTWLTYQAANGAVIPGGTPLGAAPVSVPYGPGDDGVDPGPRVVRRSGADRYATSTALSADGWASAPSVVVASGVVFADALAASGLAAQLDAPVLLTRGRGTDAPLLADLDRLDTTTVHLAGGEERLDAAFARSLITAGHRVVRHAGADRFATAAELLDESATGRRVPAITLALGAAPEGQDAWPDALAASSLVGATGWDLLLTRRDAMPQATVDALAEHLQRGATVTILGGPAAVAPAVETQLQQRGYEVERIEGADRYETAANIAAAARVAGATSDQIVLTSGRSFADALGAGPLAVRKGGILLLTDPNDLGRSATTEAVLRREATAIDRVTLAGGPAAISDVVFSQVARAITR